MNYYNEWDPQAAAWLRELIAERLLPRGLVDERSITEVEAKDLEGFTQCHFFAGIGGWPLALQLAGVPATAQLWTGSPPCQPFSSAGKQLGQFDPRHLAPVFLQLIGQCRPAILFGEQVAAAIGKSWMCDLQVHLERENYAVGFAVLPACSVGAPHKRERLFFGAHQLADTIGERPQSRRQDKEWGAVNGHIGRGCSTGGVGNPNSKRLNGQHPLLQRAGEENLSQVTWASQDGGIWSNADWLRCRDGAIRPVEPGTFPLANGVSARVGRLRGYGNAIVPQVAAEFIRAFMASAIDVFEGKK